MGYLKDRLIGTIHKEDCCCGECGCEKDHDQEEIVEKSLNESEIEGIISEKYSESNDIRLIEVPYIIHSYAKLSDFLTKTIIEKIDPYTIINYNDLYVLGDLINDNST